MSESKIIHITEKLPYNMKILFRYYAYRYGAVFFFSDKQRVTKGRKRVDIELDELERVLEQIKEGRKGKPRANSEKEGGGSTKLIELLENIVQEAKNEND